MRWLRDWSPRKLFAAWIAYWVALAVVGLAPAIPALWRATHADTGQGGFSFGYGSGVFSLAVTLSGNTIWSGSVHALLLALWIGVPPLLLWLAWLSQRSPIGESRSSVR
jgi:hypothetical protein